MSENNGLFELVDEFNRLHGLICAARICAASTEVDCPAIEELIYTIENHADAFRDVLNCIRYVEKEGAS